MKYRDDSFTTHQPRVIYDQARGSQSLFWDANGNLSQTVDCKTGAASINFWDEENRLRLAVNPKFVGYYGYDANGERVYKLTGSTQYDDLNGSNPSFGIIFDGLTVYPSPYIVLTEKQYTKHYYAGTERLATVIGGGGLGEIGNPVDRQHSQHDLDIISSFNSRYSDYDPFEHENNLSEPVGTVGIDGTPNPRLDYTCSSIVLTDLDVLTHQNILLEAIELNAPTMTLEQNVYFFHGDHLGSASWITDGGGNPIQYIHYAPYGELIANQQTIGYDERYKFTGKERDWETGYDYFGARFYDYRKGFWNSVDPLADKHPNVTPYLYCNGNPVMLVDPDGRDTLFFNDNGDFTHRVSSDGAHIGVWNKNDESITFGFQNQSDADRFFVLETPDYYDAICERKGIDESALTRLIFYSANGVLDKILQNVPKEKMGLLKTLVYVINESRDGKLDYNASNHALPQDAIYLVEGIDEAQNNYNFGNFLWGKSMNLLNLPYHITLFGANLDNLLHHGTLDSKDDQKSILWGYFYK